MIKRKTSKANMSLVNMAQEEHLSVSGGIVTSTPVTNLQTVKSSTNFELDNDGSYILRKPLVLKETIPSKDTYYLYDKETKISFNNGVLQIIGKDNTTPHLRFYDLHTVLHTITYDENFDFVVEFINLYNAIDHTLISVRIDTQKFYSNIHHYLIHDPQTSVYRFLKVYKDTDLGNNHWVVEIVHPEFNSITSSLNEQAQLDVNMLLDNPYAIRDLYGYGYISTTKILAYMPLGYSEQELTTGNIPVYKLTESNVIDNKGFKLIVSSNTTALGNGKIVLKAFITETTPATGVTYYACWEMSSNGITWEACPEFISKFQNSLVEQKVLDITFAEFDKLIFNDSLTEAAAYLVTKRLVPFTKITSEDNILAARPDVLLVNSLNYQYRFSIYVDTGIQQKEYTISKIASSNYFKESSYGEFVPLDSEEAFSYCVNANYGYHYGENSGDPSFSDGVITLRPGQDDNKDGNGITIKFTNPEEGSIKKIKITIGEKQKDTSPGAGTSDYVDVKSVLKYTLQKTSKIGIFGGYLNDDSPYSVSISLHAYTEELYGKLFDELSLAEGPWGGGEFQLENSKTSSYNDYDGFDISDDVIRLGYGTLEGFYFIFTRQEVFAGETYNIGDAVIATRTGWVKRQGPVTPIPTTVVEKIVHTTATEDIVIDLEEYKEYSIKSIELCCFSNSYYDASNLYKYNLRIAGIQINYDKITHVENSTSTYLVSSAGPMTAQWSKNTILVEDLTKQRQNIFRSEMFFDKGSYKFFAKDNVYYSDLDSFIVKALNVLHFSNTVTRILPYRNYLVVFTTKDISLVSIDDGTYFTKVISSTVGLPAADAKTATVILNSIYFKSETKVYKLVPNLYAYKDDVINIQQISLPIDDLFSHIVNQIFETSNFGYTDINTYRIFIPAGNSLTYCFIYDLNKKSWTLQKYPVALHRLEVNTLNEAYVVKDMVSVDSVGGGLYHFKDNIETLLEKIRLQEFDRIRAKEVGGNTVYNTIKAKYIDDYGTTIQRPVVWGKSNYSIIDAELVYSKIPYGDYLQRDPHYLYMFVNSESLSMIENNAPVEFADLKVNPIEFRIDFGQKSSNYMLDKQFLETKMIFATLHPKDMFPVSVDITTDGYQKPLHWDCNTDSALWKDAFDQLDILNTDLQDENFDYDGIFRQLILKYSGKGKTARHFIYGMSKYRFKFISMNVRYRILPNKQ